MLPEFQHLPLYGSFKELRGIGDPDFFHHVRTVRLHGFDADFQPLGDFFILESSPDQLQDFLFASGQSFGASLAGREACLQ